MRNLHLTSPHMHGVDVANLQVQLVKHNYMSAKPDSDYGPMTAQAVYRAKYYLGYPKPDQVAGEMLMKYLLGKKRRSVLMLSLARKRRPKVQIILRAKALNNARSHIGEKEIPSGSNRVIWASLWYGVVGPWCAMAVTRWYVDAGSKAFKRGKRYAYVPYIVADAGAGRNNLALTRNPLPGDIVCYDWNRDKLADHTGLFESWIVPGKTFHAIEGNTGVGNDSNGGEVMRREREVSTVRAFVHVGK